MMKVYTLFVEDPVDGFELVVGSYAQEWAARSAAEAFKGKIWRIVQWRMLDANVVVTSEAVEKRGAQ